MRKMFTVLALLALAVPAFALQINEIRIDQAGADDDEYFELAGDPMESLDGLTYLVIGDGASGSGTIEAVISLDGYSIQADGFFAMGEASFTGACGSIDATGNLNFENSDNVTHMLVDGFTGADGDDLDTDDDGTLDATPWASVLQSLSVIESPGSGDHYYGMEEVGPDGTFMPGHVLFCPAGWLIGGYDICTHDTPGEANNTCSVSNDDVSFGELKASYR